MFQHMPISYMNLYRFMFDIILFTKNIEILEKPVMPLKNFK